MTIPEVPAFRGALDPRYGGGSGRGEPFLEGHLKGHADEIEADSRPTRSPSQSSPSTTRRSTTACRGALRSRQASTTPSPACRSPTSTVLGSRHHHNAANTSTTLPAALSPIPLII